MSSAVVQIAEALTSTLNDGSFSQSFTATRRAAITRRLEDSQELTVTLVPQSYAVGYETRAQQTGEIGVYVVIQKPVTHDANDDEDAMIGFVEEIIAFVSDPSRRVLNLDGGGQAMFVRVQADPLYNAEDLFSLNQFTASPVVTYRTVTN